MRPGEALRDGLGRVVAQAFELGVLRLAQPFDDRSISFVSSNSPTSEPRSALPAPSIQEMLGHSDLSSTQVYTQVTITKPKEMHPAAKLARKVDAQDDVGADQAGLLAQLDVEAEEGGTARPGPG